MTRRGQIHRERLLSQILIEQIDDDDVSIFCPASVSHRLHQRFLSKSISASAPKPAIFETYPDGELVITLTHDQATEEIREFVSSLPFDALQ